jgi:hypothetical protein
MRTLLTVVLSVALFTSTAFAAVAADKKDGGARIRPTDSRSEAMLREGMARSQTFRDLVDRLESSNVFVYVSISPLLKSSLSGGLNWMTQAGPFRYLRATISSELSHNQTIAALAHELQHAVEVLDDTSVVSEKTLVELYRRIGHPSRAAVASGWETVAAQETGYRVRRELVEATTTATVLASRMSDSDQV